MQLSEYTTIHRGAKSQIARALGIPPQLVGQWANGVRAVPIARCSQIEQATQKVVTRRDLRPDDWMVIWPELIARTRRPTTQKEAANA